MFEAGEGVSDSGGFCSSDLIWEFPGDVTVEES